ncbi:MAG: cytochrome P450 [Myxococcales bacterium]|nr:cytochrome P450 [Myxococcales bacterium]
MAPGEPVFGHLRVLRDRPLQQFVQWADTYGDAVSMRLPGSPFVFVAAPEGVKHVLQTHAKLYSKQTRGFDKMRLFLGNGLVTSEGDFWRRQRRIAAPAFHRQRIEGFAETMTRATGDMLGRWAREGDGTRDVERELMTLTMRIASETLLGKDLSGAADAVGEALSFLTVNTTERINRVVDLPLDWPTPENRRYLKAVAVVDAVLGKLIEERRRDGAPHHDLLSMLLEATDEETHEKMTDAQLRDEAVTIFAAGHETTSNALSWTFYLLGRHPEIAARLYAEVDRVLGGRCPTLADLPQLAFTKQVIQESMRLYPPAWIIGRRAEVDDTLCGYKIAAGTQVILSPYATHRHPRHWADPEVFDPDRFSAERSEGRAAFAYFPFGGGPRICIGNSFAMMEAQLILAMVSQAYRLELAPGTVVEAERGITLRPAPALPMRLRPRAQAATAPREATS